MLSRNKVKWIKSLSHKKHRTETGCFLAEGNKLVADLLPYFDCELLITCASWLATQGDIRAGEILAVDREEIERTSLLKNPQEVIAIFRQPSFLLQPTTLTDKLSLVLDGIQDPGNLGTIIRLADWFGIENVICSPDTVDVYNPKVIQASMGAIARVKVHYTPLKEFIRSFSSQTDFPVYGTFLDGKNIYHQPLSNHGLIVMGNEGNGISEEIESAISRKLFIPEFPENRTTSESLNVAIATSIVCAEFRRREIQPV